MSPWSRCSMRLQRPGRVKVSLFTVHVPNRPGLAVANRSGSVIAGTWCRNSPRKTKASPSTGPAREGSFEADHVRCLARESYNSREAKRRVFKGDCGAKVGLVSDRAGFFTFCGDDCPPSG